MERFVITSGSFLKNAGIVAMEYALKIYGAKKNRDYGITDDDQGLWIEKEYALNADWTDMYFKAFIEHFGPVTVFPEVLKRIDLCIEKIHNDNLDVTKEEKDALKFINDKLLSNSYKSGFDNIKEQIDHKEIYEELMKEKLSDRMEQDQLCRRLEELQDFLQQPLCIETFSMKSIIYNYVNRFWDAKCFLLRSNAKKNMREVFAKDFGEPLIKYWENDHSKSKELCIDCGMPMDSKEKVSIAFMKEMADDLARKKSAFWDGKVDAFLCPVCAFVYALSPLGFQLIGNKFVFINSNESITTLLSSNTKKSKVMMGEEKQEGEKYPAWFARAMNAVLSEKSKELYNLQIILRGTNADDRYLFSVISKDALQVLKHEKVNDYITKLAKHPITKIGNEYLNIYENVVLNLLQYHEQYPLLNRLLKASIENEGILGTAYLVYCIQLRTYIIRDGKGGNVFMSRFKMRDSGYALRKALLESRGFTTDDCLRGTIYQLLNALAVGNEEKFMDIVMRIYCSSKLLMPDGFVGMIGNQQQFKESGYAFVLGLKGSHPKNVPTVNDKEEK